MYNKPIPFINFFKTKRVIELADLVTTEIEATEQYYVHKCRYTNEYGESYSNGDIISKTEFYMILPRAKRPIVLSDTYIDLGFNLN